MIAGALAQLQTPAEAALESWAADGDDLPAIEVNTTQHSFDDRPVQSGTVAKRTVERYPRAHVDARGETPTIRDSVEEITQHLVTDWVADVTGSGLVVAESANGDDDLSFPFDVFYNRTGSKAERLRVRVAELEDAWDEEGVLADVWMVGSEDIDGTSIDYHDRASGDDDATIGLGFERGWNGTVVRGVVYRSGYLACYNLDRASAFIRFVEEELLPFGYVPDDNPLGGQATLAESTDTSGNDEERTPDADACEYCGGGDYAGLEPVQGIMLCNVCQDGIEEGVLSIEEVREEVESDGE